MGLDSYVIMRSRKCFDENEIPSWVRTSCREEDGMYEYEIAYFRKAWAIHDLMYELPNSTLSPDDCGFVGNVQDLRAFRDGLHEMLNDPDLFNQRSQVFFLDEDNTLLNLSQSIMNCSWAIEVAETELVEFEFIDSY